MKNVLIAVTVSFCLSACSTTVPRENTRRANYGPQLSGPEAIEKTRRHFEQVLIDPDSLKLNCSQDVRKGWARENMFDEPIYGYLVRCYANAKNTFGGYTGNKDYAIIVNGSRVFAVEVNKNANMQRNPERWMGYAE